MNRKILIGLLPILSLAGCSGASKTVNAGYRFTTEKGLPTIYALGEGTHTTYLMMSKYGYLYISGTETHGEDVPEKFYENCIVWKTDANGALPSKDQVKSTVNGATFRGWAKYNDNIYPDYLTNVPSISGQAVYAIFDGTSAGGGGGGGGSTPVDSYTATFNVDLTIFDGWEGISGFSLYVWGQNGEEPLGKWDSCEGNLTGSGNIKSVTTPSISYGIVGAVFYFVQTGGDTPGKKQTTNMVISITETGTYNIAPTGSEITWVNDNGTYKMSNFTISKAS